MRNPLGPFHTRDDLTAAAQPLHDALRAATPDGTPASAIGRARARVRFRYLIDAFTDAGVDLGNADVAIARVLVGSSVETLVVLRDWLARAGVAGESSGNVELVALLADAACHLEPCPPGPGGRCEHGQWAECQRTDVAYRLRGLDVGQARAHALETLRGDR